MCVAYRRPCWPCPRPHVTWQRRSGLLGNLSISNSRSPPHSLIRLVLLGDTLSAETLTFLKLSVPFDLGRRPDNFTCRLSVRVQSSPTTESMASTPPLLEPKGPRCATIVFFFHQLILLLCFCYGVTRVPFCDKYFFQEHFYSAFVSVCLILTFP